MKDKNRLLDIIEEEEEEATWLETFADMSMLLLTFFILLYSLSSLDKKVFNTYLMSIKKALGGEIKEVQGVKISLNEEEGILLQEVKLRHQIIEQQSQVFSDFNLYYTQKGIEGVVGAKFDKGKIIIALSGDVLFPPGKVTLTPKGKAVLKKLKGF